MPELTGTIPETASPVPFRTAAPIGSPTPAPSRLVSVAVQGTPVQLPCPPWCVLPHDDQRLVELADLAHYGAEMSVQLPTFSGATESGITVHLACYPFSSDEDRTPYLALVSPSGESTPLTADLAETVAQGLERHAAMMRALAGAV